jgi:hypothetical protein
MVQRKAHKIAFAMDRTVATVSDDGHSLASTVPCTLEHDPYGKNDSLLLEVKDVEGMTDDINYHLYTFWNKVKHTWGFPCDSLQHIEDYRRGSGVRPRIFPWRVYGMCTLMRSLLYARWKELELHALSDSFEEERQLAESTLEQESYEQEMEERTILYLEEVDNEDQYDDRTLLSVHHLQEISEKDKYTLYTTSRRLRYIASTEPERAPLQPVHLLSMNTWMLEHLFLEWTDLLLHANLREADEIREGEELEYHQYVAYEMEYIDHDDYNTPPSSSDSIDY